MYCRERAVAPTTLPIYKSEVAHDGRTYAVDVKDLEVLQCVRCGEMVLDDAANRRVSDALREKVGLLFPDEIRAKREALGLTQKQLASLLCVSECTLSRWETGSQLQQRCMDRFLRCVFDVSETRRFLLDFAGSTATVSSLEASVETTCQPA
jgi:putative zinc finger/helix-turn-helix YgiT family protein